MVVPRARGVDLGSAGRSADGRLPESLSGIYTLAARIRTLIHRAQPSTAEVFSSLLRARIASTFGHELAHHGIDIAVPDQSQAQRPADVEGPRPASHDAHRALIRFAPDARPRRRAAHPFQAGEHLRGRDAQSRKV